MGCSTNLAKMTTNEGLVVHIGRLNHITHNNVRITLCITYWPELKTAQTMYERNSEMKT